MKLLIAVPAHENIHVEFVKSLTALVMRLTREEVRFDVVFESGTLVYVARDKLASKAINEGYTHVLWLDADMVFSDAILEDLQFSGKDFVSGIYHARRKPYCSCLFEHIDLKNLSRYDKKPYPSNTFEIEGCGFGCVLIATEILNAVMKKHKTCFLPMQYYGEDIAFCKRARELGYKIYGEPGVVCGHIGHDIIYPEDYERWRAELERGKHS